MIGVDLDDTRRIEPAHVGCPVGLGTLIGLGTASYRLCGQIRSSWLADRSPASISQMATAKP
jgi:hypothetical protein